MKPMAKVAAMLYLLSCALVLGAFTALLVGPAQDQAASLVERQPARIILLVCMGIMGIQALYLLGRVLFMRPEPMSVRPTAHPDIEVALDAVRHVARRAAMEEDVLIEDVSTRVRGRSHEGVLVRIDAIDLGDRNLAALAAKIAARVQRACEHMLGAPGATVRVRFLPAKTTTTTREATGE